ncbi:MAG: hypothetical protein E6X17_03155 [Sporomusaceae bacterium]|nr:hypothetical protein [Sporomusaceae bacterium]
MDGIVCANCSQFAPVTSAACPGCGSAFIRSGAQKNIIDQLEPNCLIHRYDGSDLLEAGTVLKKGKSNYKVALKLSDYTKPITVPRHKVYHYNPELFGAVQELRSQRAASSLQFEQQIGSHWSRLQPFMAD